MKKHLSSVKDRIVNDHKKSNINLELGSQEEPFYQSMVWLEMLTGSRVQGSEHLYSDTPLSPL